MRTGTLDRRITIQAKGPPVDDGMRTKDGEWVEIGNRWAALTPLSGAERVVAAEKEAVSTLKFRVRRDSLTKSLNPALHRIVYLGVAYDLKDVAEFERQGIDLLVEGRADGGEG